ncbi:enoyl-CoA hydratase/isomerase family protein [Actinoplanes sp. N902-109]|uniref:enoyl-CoA hydratase/isomerase family protein n=1 Tax=Actinoplanes sp. (strain N902-109) TaxID=649831 RepID=UPI0003296157|nr:enoyl-CoA hydratase/isomerase family protein [Actinoplanes sp. N902-109]AGL17095.1 enoyl-CoA hydratase/isomerase [Actinoplanes sp. N902-109]
MTFTDLSALRVDVQHGVATVTIDHPPLNLLDAELVADLHRFVAQVRDDDTVRVIVFESADPEFFIAHGDMRFLTEPEKHAFPDDLPPGTNVVQAVNEAVRSLPQVTIGKLAGLARGGGNELLMALDMRFAALGRSGQAQPETLQGIYPGGGGTQYLTALVGRARALELILGGELAGAELAERYGLINRALPADELDGFVTGLARRIAALGPVIIDVVKNAVDAADTAPYDMAAESALAARFSLPDVAAFARRQLDAGVQTRAGELRLEEILRSLQAGNQPTSTAP